jgi:ankyrin repeat protein
MVGFKYGNYVLLQGLSNAAYNGQLARIQCLSADVNNGRFRVELQVDEEVASSHLSREILVKLENMARACDCCHQAGAGTMQYCGKCRNVAYCNAECQRSDWQRHKVECSNMNARRQIHKSPLILAAAMGDLAEVEKLVGEGADVNKATKEDGCTPLIVAATMGQLAVVRYLVQHSADKNKADNAGTTPLLIAAQGGHLTVVQYLIQQGADKEKAINNGATPLFIAAQDGHLVVVQYLVQQGADKNKATSNGATPLWIAAGKGHMAVVQFLVQRGAHINQAAESGFTPLIAATNQGHTAVANYLREQGAV